MEGGGGCIAVFVLFALCGAVIGDGDGAAGEGGIAADLDGGNIIGGAGGGEGTVRYGEVAIDIDGSGGEFSGTDGDSSAIDGEVGFVIRRSLLVMHLDGTDGKGAGAGDGEVLIFSLDCGKGAISYEDEADLIKDDLRNSFENLKKFYEKMAEQERAVLVSIC